VPPHGGFDSSPTFTPDGNYVYYLHEDPANPNNTNLYAVPALGGTSRLVVSDVASGVDFSPDGKRMAYRRTIAASGESQLLIANSDGSEESVIHRLQLPKLFYTAPSWSVSGEYIATGMCEGGGDALCSIVVFTPRGELVKSFPLDLVVLSVAWMPDGSGLLFAGGEKSTGLRWQIWFQPFPAGQPYKVTNDLNQYLSVRATADGKSFVTTQRHPSATIYVGESPSKLSDKMDWKLTPISTQQATGLDLSWTASGKLLQRDLAFRVYMTAPDGTGRLRLLENAPTLIKIRSCGPGDEALATVLSSKNTLNLWRFNLATGDSKQLTSGLDEEGPSCTPDGKWAAYIGHADDKISEPAIFKIPVDGRVPVEMARGDVGFPAVSPDGSLVAYVKVEGQGASTKSKLVVQKLDGGAPIEELEAPSDARLTLGWSPDGRGLTYLHTVGSARHLYMQPRSGGPPIQLTHFDEEPSWISAYAWSRDGKKIAITRARFADTDVVMFSGFR